MATKPVWSVEPGRLIHRNGDYQFAIASNRTGTGLPPADLDLMAHRIVALLNAAGRRKP